MSKPKKVFKSVELAIPTPRNIDNTPCQTVDPEIFFPDPTDVIGIEKAKTLCGNCDQTNKNTCLSFALTNKVRYGVWGGLTSDERQKLVRQRNRSK